MAAPSVIAFHKPVGLITTHRDQLGRETVYDRLRSLLPVAWACLPWHAVGRLDKDTSGLLLFTTDGGLVHHATQPATGLRKRYRVLAKGLISAEQLEALRRGVPLTGGLGTSAPARAELIAHNTGTSWITVEVTEGRNREVRRMLLAVGSQAIRLTRVAVGGLELDLPENGWRVVSPGEVEATLGYRRSAPVRPARPIRLEPAGGTRRVPRRRR